MPFLATLFTAGSLLGALASAAISFGISYLASKLTTRSIGRQKTRAYTAVNGEVQVGGDVPEPCAFGFVVLAGYQAYYAKFGSGNKYNAEVFVFSSGRCDGLEPYLILNGEKRALIGATAIGGEAAHYTVAGFEGLISIRFYDGRPGQVADAKLVSDTAGLGNPWKATSRGTNLCYVVVQYTYDPKFNGRSPQFVFILRGIRCYDPRKDSTFSGGSGAHRLSNPTTWSFTRNPAIQRLNYQIGFKGVASNITLIGMGLPLAALDMNSYIASANVCDTKRIVDGRSIDTYHCNLIVKSTDDHSQVLKEFDDSMAAYGLNRSGLAGVLAGAPQVPVREITDEDIRTDAPQNVQYRRSSFDQINHLTGQFTSPESLFQPESLIPVTNTTDILADGRARTQSNDFLQVMDADIAQYLLTIRYRQNRLGARVTLPVSARLWFVSEIGEWVDYDGRTWLIVTKDGGSLTLAETSGDVYAEGGIVPGPIFIAPSELTNPSLLTTVNNFQMGSGIIQGVGYDQIPALRFVWNAPEDPSIYQVLIKYQIEGGGEVYEAVCNLPESGGLTVSANVVSHRTYRAQATILTRPDRYRTWTPWVTTSVPTVDVSMLWRQTQAEIKELVKNLRLDVDEVKDLVTLEGAQASTLDTGNSFLRRRSLQKSSDNNFARIINEELVRADADSALAQVLTAVEASVNEVSAFGLFKMKASVGPGGASVIVSLQARIDDGDNFTDSGLALEVYETSPGVYGSRATILSDKFVVTDGTTTTPPFIFAGGNMIFNGVLQSADGKRRIDANGTEFIRMWT